MNPLELLRDYILRTHPSATAHLTPPFRDEGMWSLDVNARDKELSIQWGANTGFGLSTVSNETFGEGPDEVLESLEDAQHRIDRLLTTRERTSPPFGVLLSRLRESRGMTQQGLATILNIRQSTLSGIERREDVQVSTLRRIIEALGGVLEVFAVFHSARFRIVMPGPRYRERPCVTVDRRLNEDAFELLHEAGTLQRATMIANDISSRGAVLEML
jgi:transcriptional regulator with XRE-family HTH domain